jgi:hypothetical protein
MRPLCQAFAMSSACSLAALAGYTGHRKHVALRLAHTLINSPNCPGMYRFPAIRNTAPKLVRRK